jgi:proteasome accessory factor B
MERTERLLDLVALLLDARQPVSWRQIRGAFPDDYGDTLSDDAADRKFERDKSELLELGIPLAFVQAKDDDEPAGYVVEKSAYYLPEVGLKPDELAVLYAAGSAALASGAFPGSQDLAHALRKIGFFAGAPMPVPRVRLELGAIADSKGLPARLEQLWAAISARKLVELQYFSPRKQETTERKVDPYGLALRRGLWSLVGYCHLRKDVRTFHVHRIRKLTVNAKNPRSVDFEIPAGFRLDEHVATWPWQHRFHPPVEVSLALKGDLAPLADSLFGSPSQPHEGAATVVVRATDLDGLLKYVASLGPEAKVLGPPEAIQRHRALLEKIATAHGSGR